MTPPIAVSVIAYNLGNLWRRLVLPNRIGNWSLTSLQQRLVKTGGRLVKHARYYWLLLTESHLTRRLFGAMAEGDCQPNPPRSSSGKVKAGEFKLMGFGHRIYKNYDPRARIIKWAADKVFEVTGRNPKLDIALSAQCDLCWVELRVRKAQWPGELLNSTGMGRRQVGSLAGVPDSTGANGASLGRSARRSTQRPLKNQAIASRHRNQEWARTNS